MLSITLIKIFCFQFLFCNTIVSIYLPGIYPHAYKANETIPLNVLQLFSTETQLPYDYYYLPFCRPKKIFQASENIGEILMGDVIKNSLYEVKMQQNYSCKILCEKQFNYHDLSIFDLMIKNNYKIHWMLDNLPAVEKYTVIKSDTEHGEPITVVTDKYKKGFPMGIHKNNKITYLNNYVKIKIKYHPIKNYGSRIVGFEVEALSKNSEDICKKGNNNINPQLIDLHNIDKNQNTTIVFAYDVEFEKSEIKWAYRWDSYFKMEDSIIHWSSIINSCFLIMILSIIVATTLIRILRKDFKRYNSINDDPELQYEETGWKLIHGDVFRPPSYPGLFSIFVGTGLQVISMTLLTIFIALLGIISPKRRGSLMTAFIILFVLMGSVAGYFSTIVYKMFRSKRYMSNTFWTTVTYPLANFIILLIINVFLTRQNSSAAISFIYMFFISLIWFCLSYPLVFIGSYFGYKKEVIKYPCKINLIPRQIPHKTSKINEWVLFYMGGLIPFSAVFVEIFFMMASLWLNQFYYMFGVIFVVFIILIIICSEVSIVICYIKLCSEDYNWWWYTYLSSGSSGLFLFIYGIFYYTFHLNITQFVSTLIFFGYMFLISMAFSILTGTIGTIAAFIFIKKIYGSIKID